MQKAMNENKELSEKYKDQVANLNNQSISLKKMESEREEMELEISRLSKLFTSATDSYNLK